MKFEMKKSVLAVVVATAMSVASFGAMADSEMDESMQYSYLNGFSGVVGDVINGNVYFHGYASTDHGDAIALNFQVGAGIDQDAHATTDWTMIDGDVGNVDVSSNATNVINSADIFADGDHNVVLALNVQVADWTMQNARAKTIGTDIIDDHTAKKINVSSNATNVGNGVDIEATGFGALAGSAQLSLGLTQDAHAKTWKTNIDGNAGNIDVSSNAINVANSAVISVTSH